MRLLRSELLFVLAGFAVACVVLVLTGGHANDDGLEYLADDRKTERKDKIASNEGSSRSGGRQGGTGYKLSLEVKPKQAVNWQKAAAGLARLAGRSETMAMKEGGTGALARAVEETMFDRKRQVRKGGKYVRRKRQVRKQENGCHSSLN